MGLIFTTFILLLALPFIIAGFCILTCIIFHFTGNVSESSGPVDLGKTWVTTKFFGVKLW